MLHTRSLLCPSQQREREREDLARPEEQERKKSDGRLAVDRTTVPKSDGQEKRRLRTYAYGRGGVGVACKGRRLSNVATICTAYIVYMAQDWIKRGVCMLP